MLNLLPVVSPRPVKLDVSAIAVALMERYSVPASERLAVEDLVRASLLGSHEDQVLNGEIKSFVDRFKLKNRDYGFQLVHHYIDDALPAGTQVFRSVRVCNNGAFTWDSRGDNPLLLSYHWLSKDGSAAVYEGARTAFPTEIAPGREITIHVRLDTPAAPGEYDLKLVLVHEFVRWAEETAATIPVTVVSMPEVVPVHQYSSEVLPKWNELEDSTIALDVIKRFVQTRLCSRDLVVLEIGGGNSVEASRLLQEIPSAKCLSVDVSESLLRLRSLSMRYNLPDLCPRLGLMSADANNLPVKDGFADGVFICRALHHFADPVHLLAHCKTKLKADAFIAVVCEPVGTAYDEETIRLLSLGVNEQIFALEDYITMFQRARLRVEYARLDWGFSLKAILTTERGC